MQLTSGYFRAPLWGSAQLFRIALTISITSMLNPSTPARAPWKHADCGYSVVDCKLSFSSLFSVPLSSSSISPSSPLNLSWAHLGLVLDFLNMKRPRPRGKAPRPRPLFTHFSAPSPSRSSCCTGRRQWHQLKQAGCSRCERSRKTLPGDISPAAPTRFMPQWILPSKHKYWLVWGKKTADEGRNAQVPHGLSLCMATHRCNLYRLLWTTLLGSNRSISVCKMQARDWTPKQITILPSTRSEKAK